MIVEIRLFHFSIAHMRELYEQGDKNVKYIDQKNAMHG